MIEQFHLEKKFKLASFIRIFLSLFDFRKPVIYRFESVDIIVAETSLLLLSWHFKRAYTLSIKSSNRKYRFRQGSVVVKLPLDARIVKVTVSNIWRRKRFDIVLVKTQLDAKTTSLLNGECLPMATPVVSSFNILPTPSIYHIELPAVSVKHFILQTKRNRLSVNQNQLKYTSYESRFL